jgi:ElaB/YqjD/DUF883 family membrane-anchored ribosome-binding protein
VLNANRTERQRAEARFCSRFVVLSPPRSIPASVRNEIPVPTLRIEQRQERTMNRESSEGGMRQKTGDAEKEGMGSHNFGGAKDSRHDKAIDHAQSAVASAKEALSSGVKAGDSEIGALQDQIGQVAGTVTQLVKDQTSRARGQVMEAVGTAGDSVSQTAAVAKDSLASLEADVEARIKRNPWSAVAIAALVGLLIGKMTW